MGAKVWGTAAVVIAAAAAAGAGIITWEGRVWDEHAQDLASYKEAPVKTVIFTETARTWRTRAFTVEVELLNGLKMVWQGGAEFGLGTKTKASLDLTQGIGAQIAADKSVEGFGDELVIETSMTGTVKPVVWRLNPITYRAPENAFVRLRWRALREKRSGRILSLASFWAAGAAERRKKLRQTLPPRNP